MNITTQRLVIRRFESGDLADYLAYESLPEMRRYLGGAPMGEERAREYLAQQAVLPENQTGCYHAFAVYHSEDQRVIGDVGFWLESGPEKKGDLGFQFHPAYQGRSYATEAAEALIRFGFVELELRRITAGCDARNVASFRVLEKLGMRREAHFRQSRITNGELHDEYAYALLRDEWLARTPEA